MFDICNALYYSVCEYARQRDKSLLFCESQVLFLNTPEIFIRPVSHEDSDGIMQILTQSPWSTQRFLPNELSALIATRPGVIVYRKNNPYTAFLLCSSVVAPSAWIGGFGAEWGEHQRLEVYLQRSLAALYPMLRASGAECLYYSGYDTENDWLKGLLLKQGFTMQSQLWSYDKYGVSIPAEGAQYVQVRPFQPETDMEAICAVENAAFAPLWRHNAQEFTEIYQNNPFFVVAVDDDGVILGYQYSDVEGSIGFLIRIGVHPALHSRGIGARLMRAAIEFFARAGAVRILLNTEEANAHAHRLYEWFGFRRVAPDGFVIAKPLTEESNSASDL